MSTPGAISQPFIKLSTSLFRRAAAQQGGLLDGEDPTVFNTSDPIRLWIIQLGVIICMTQLLSLGLSRIRQPKVIAEVLGGIVLGPTLMGRIPGFTQHIFPSESRPYLALTADIGLVLFLFLVGLEIDTKVIKRNAKTSFIISAGGITLPFGLGVACAIPIYNQFVDQSQSFPHFMLFVGVAFSITAFPVLCRILTELKLLDDVIGVIVLSAGVGNDIVGWVLLALTVALVNASSGLTALYVLLVSVGWTLVVLYPIRWAYEWLARFTGSNERGPTPIFMTATILLVFASAFMTDVIGVNAIFGGFLAGLVIPRDGGLNITITEKLEDMVAIIFLPLYFTLSGLSTNLGLLNNGITWGYTIMILVVAYIGKFGGGTGAARFAGFGWRESMTVGTLMSCKGLIELIVLNVGLSAGILDTRVFSMFVLEAVVLTFACTPIALLLYPPHVRTRAAATGGNFGYLSGSAKPKGDLSHSAEKKDRFLVVLDKMSHVPSILAITQLLAPPKPTVSKKATKRKSQEDQTHPSSEPAEGVAPASPIPPTPTTEVTALRLVELTDRTSSLLRASVPEELIQRDPLLDVFHMFGGLNDITVTDRLAVSSYDDYSDTVGQAAQDSASQLIILSWPSPPMTFKNASTGVPLTIAPTMASEHSQPGVGSPTPQVTIHQNPLAALFRGAETTTGAGPSQPHHSHPTPAALSKHEKISSLARSHFIRRLYASAPTDVALFVDNQGSLKRSAGSKAHLVVPFFGGRDDRLALEFAVQLCEREEVTATIVRIAKENAPGTRLSVTREETGTEETGKEKEKEDDGPHQHEGTLGGTLTAQMNRFPDTIYPHVTTQTRLASDTADNLSWFKYAPNPDPDATEPPTHSELTQAALTRITFEYLSSPAPLQAMTAKVAEMTVRKQQVLVIVGRAKRLAVESHQDEMLSLLGAEHQHGLGNEMRKTLGDVATAFVVSAAGNGLLVMQASATTSAEV